MFSCPWHSIPGLQDQEFGAGLGSNDVELTPVCISWRGISEDVLG